MTDEPRTITVRNITLGPIYVDGGGPLTYGEDGPALDSDHTRSLIAAGVLLEMPAAAKVKPKPDPNPEA